MTGQKDENYSSGKYRLKLVVIKALIRCMSVLMSSFLNRLIFPKRVSPQKNSNRVKRTQMGANVDFMYSPVFGHIRSGDALVPCQRQAPINYSYKMLLSPQTCSFHISCRQHWRILIPHSWVTARLYFHFTLLLAIMKIFSPTTFLPLGRNSKTVC